MEARKRVFVAGADTMIGAAIVRRVRRAGGYELIGLHGNSLDYTNPAAVAAFFTAVRPHQIYLAAGRSGGISANQRYPAQLMYDNLMAAATLIDAAYRHRVTKLLYLGSSCCYPRQCAQPMQVSQLLAGPLEPTNEPYALAKLAGIKLCQAYRRQHGCRFIAGIPANAFGPEDDFDPEDAHVIPALIHRFNEARLHGEAEVVVWGSGQARREFIFADDLADACLTVMNRYDEDEPINLGSGSAVSIGELVEVIRAVVGYAGKVRFDTTRPDGMPAKSLDGTALAAMGWKPATDLESAIRQTYRWYLAHHATAPMVARV